MAMKKGIFFTIDGIVAASILLLVILLAANFYTSEHQSANINYASQDLVRVFSNLKVAEQNNDYVSGLISSGKIIRENNTILEQIGEFWANNELELATNFTRNISSAIVPERYGFSVAVDGDIIYSRVSNITKSLASSKKIISGIAKLKPIEGYVTKVILSSINNRKITAYAYFGGYVGDGIINQYLLLPNNYTAISSAYMEFALGSNFDLEINGISSGTYNKTQVNDINSNKFNISPIYYGNFVPGINNIKITFMNLSNYIGGGYIRVFSDSTDVGYLPFTYDPINNNISRKEYLNGIDGIINLYSSFYVPGDLKSLNVFLNYTTDYPLFVSFGNITIYNQNFTGNISVLLTNSTLYGYFNDSYLGLNRKTVPLRIGHFSTESVKSLGKFTDLFIATPIDTSMDTEDVQDSPGLSRLDVTKIVEKGFVNFVLNQSLSNRIGLSPYHASVEPGQTEDLTNNNVTLINKIDAFHTKSVNVCFSCAIGYSRDLLEVQGDKTKKWNILLIGDGFSNKCDEIPSARCTAEATINESLEFACNASRELNITIYTVAIGAGSDNRTLKNISEDCSNGKFYYTENRSQLQEAFTEIADKILFLNYTFQTAVTSGVSSALHPNSYIEMQYIPAAQPYVFGKIPISLETPPFGNNLTAGNITIPNNANLTELVITSYSGNKWTDKIKINNGIVFNLSSYNRSYTELGDPFLVNVPVSALIVGNNTADIKTATGSSGNSSGGSIDDKGIYTVLVDNSISYSSVAARAAGCSWVLDFIDGTTTIMNVPSSYSGNMTCYYSNQTYDTTDSVDTAAYQLFGNLDVDKDGKLDVNLNVNNLNVITLTVSKVPTLWGPAIIEVRVWE